MSSATAPRSVQHRYGLVLLLTVIAVVDVIIAPDTPLSRGIGVLLQGTVLLVVIATARGSRAVRRVRAIAAAGVLLALAVGVATSVISPKLGSSLAGIAIVAVLVELVRGVGRLIRAQGVTLQAVAGALAIYMLVGLTFALMIGFIAYIGPAYFAQGNPQPLSQQVYFSFTTMTTTGYGDLTPATRVGRAVSVLEMLIGQIYLVTVIGLLVGNFNRRSARADNAPSA
ncbi:MAG TPA: ion channel [Solirubrobacteraceae bacterium]|nr:ion channel [Solirubrobacteraceae bacterium]